MLSHLNKSIVQEKHGGSQVPSPSPAPEEHLPEVTNVSNLGMAHTKLPNEEAGVQHQCSDHDGEDETWD